MKKALSFFSEIRRPVTVAVITAVLFTCLYISTGISSSIFSQESVDSSNSESAAPVKTEGETETVIVEPTEKESPSTGEELKSTDTAEPVVKPEKTIEETAEKTTGETGEKKIISEPETTKKTITKKNLKKKGKGQIKSVKQKAVNTADQFRWTPEDPSFLYENRHIPGKKLDEEFLSVEQEKEVVSERIEEEKTFRESLEKIDFQLPDPAQVAVIVVFMLLFVLYRTRIAKGKGGRRS